MGGRPVLGPLALRVVLPSALDRIAELGRDLHLFARHARKCLADDLLVRARAVDVSGVEEGDAELERPFDQVHALAPGDLPPPGRAERPGPEADLGAGQI